MSSGDLLKVYFTTLRSAVEYCSVVYHSLIPAYVSERLERVQLQAMKIIFGHGVNYMELVENGTVETLEKRREASCLKFAAKAAMTARFGPRWIPLNGIEREARSTTRRKYMERRHKTQRSKNNPLQYMVRQLNEQA